MINHIRSKATPYIMLDLAGKHRTRLRASYPSLYWVVSQCQIPVSLFIGGGGGGGGGGGNASATARGISRR